MGRSILHWALVAPLLAGATFGQDPSPQKSLEERFKEMQDRYEARISALEGEVRSLRADAASRPDDDASALDQAIAALPQPPKPAPSPPAFQLGPAKVSLIEISMDVLFAVGTSTATESQIQDLEGGGHDPKKRGFTLSQVELSATGAIDPYFMGEVHLAYFIDPDGASEFELEEAFLTTTSLPCGLQVEAGQSFLDFGRINPQHPHQWSFLDQPVVNTRMFGGDGIRAPGVCVRWLTKLPWFCELHFGAYNANGETMTSFYASDEAIGGRPFVDQEVRDFGDLVYILRLDNSVELNKCTTVKGGVSALFGPNATGAAGRTSILGADLLVKYQPINTFRGFPFVTWQSEVMFRDYRADSYFDAVDPGNPADDIAIPSGTLDDWGLYSQIVYGFTFGWVAGVRYEYASGSGTDYDSTTGMPVSREDDPFRDDRHRFSALMTYYPSEYSRLRLQYNLDHADHLQNDVAHSIWFGVEFLFGKHPAHAY